MDENIIIRDMKPEDFPQADRLMQQLHRKHVDGRPDLYKEMEHPYSEEKFSELIHQKDMICIIAEEEGKALGLCFVSFRSRTGMIQRRTAYMDDLCVDEACRRQGIGRKLFAYAEKRAKEMGAERLDLMVWGFNEEAVAFYQSEGMQIQRYILEKKL